MDRKSAFTTAVIASVIVAVMLNVIAFAAPFTHNVTFWVCYAFIWVAVLATVGVSYYIYSTGRSLTSALYRTSVVAIAIGYLAAASILSLVLMFVGVAPTWLAVVLHVVLLGVCLLGALGGDAGARIVDAGDATTAAQTSFMHALNTQSQMALAVPCDDATKKRLAQLAESIRYSDPVSSPATAQMEEQLVGLMTQVNMMLANGDTAGAMDLCDKVQVFLDQRNLICKNAK